MVEALETALERFAGRRTAQGGPVRHRFAVLPSPQEPRCLLPLGDCRTTLEGFRVYTPYALGERLRKGLLSQLIKTGWSGWALHSLYVGEPLGLKALVTNITGERNPAFAMLLGTPGKYRKLTVQVMRSSGATLGYIKLGLTKPASERVRHEAAMLEELSALRLRIPGVLYAGEWQDSHLLFQSPAEGRPGPSDLSGMHTEFLQKLAGMGRTDKSGVRVVEEIGARWSAVTWRCDWRWHELGAAVLSAARRDLQNVTVPCAFWHGDFVPWNTRVDGGRLAVFDWESSEPEMPLGWDAFHFSVQVAGRLKKGWRTKFELSATPGARGLFLLYLLFSLGRSLDERAESNQDLDYRRRALATELAAR
ncbi:MAG TPA: phosphotransferase [Bryobacteraceae bacterium]|nr:phosphotransferase [Bryobacteraceae bacterium]